jgi:methylenetetrahydrofolate reductase (NADPH)
MKFEDEPVPGYPLPILPGHTSPGRLERVLRSGAFAVTSELDPPDSADPEDVLRRARVFDGYRGRDQCHRWQRCQLPHVQPGRVRVADAQGLCAVMQISCRDKNRIAIQGDILGGAAMGVANMLCLTGDGVQSGDHPQAKPVFDLDCMSLLEMARNMRDNHQFQSGRKITFAPRVFLGAAANPFGLPFEWRAERLAKKVQAGAQFVQTQYCYDVPRLRTFMKKVEDLGLLGKVFILVGVGPLRSAKAAEWMRTNVPGIHIPDEHYQAHGRCRKAGARRPQDLHRHDPGGARIKGVSGRAHDGLPARRNRGRNHPEIRRAAAAECPGIPKRDQHPAIPHTQGRTA